MLNLCFHKYAHNRHKQSVLRNTDHLFGAKPGSYHCEENLRSALAVRKALCHD